MLVEGGVQHLPEALPAQLKDDGRLVFVRVGEVMGECRVRVRSGDSFGEIGVFDATAPLLEGFEAIREFQL